MALVSLPASELPPAPLFASLFYLLHSWSSSSSSLSLSLSCSLTHSCPPLCPSWNVVTLFRGGKKGGLVGGGESRIGAFIFLPPKNSLLLKWSLLAPPHVHRHTHTHTHTHSIHWPPPRLPRVAYLTSPPLHLSSLQSMLAHVCANVTSIFHRQPLPVSRPPPSKNICRTRQPSSGTGRCRKLEAHVQMLTHTREKLCSPVNTIRMMWIIKRGGATTASHFHKACETFKNERKSKLRDLDWILHFPWCNSITFFIIIHPNSLAQFVTHAFCRIYQLSHNVDF